MVNKTSDEIQIKDINTWKRGHIYHFSKSRMQEGVLKVAPSAVVMEEDN